MRAAPPWLCLRGDRARVSNIEMGRRVGLTPAPCLRRVRRLEELGVVRGYRADIDPEAEGRGMEVIAFVEISQMSRAAIDAFESAVVQLDEIIQARRMFGTPDYLLTVTVPDHHAYEGFVTNKLSTVPHMARVASHQTMKNLKTLTERRSPAPLATPTMEAE